LVVAGLALALGTLPGCHDDNNSNLPAIIPVPNSVVVADINGVQDLLVATTADEGYSQNPGYANVIRNSPPGTFQTGVHLPTTGTNPSSIAVADLTGTGSLDLVIANFGSGSVSVFMQQGTTGTFKPAMDVPTGGQPNQVVSCDPHAVPPAVPCDLAGNGKPSLVLADMSTSGNVIVLKADPDPAAPPGKFLAPISLPTGLVTPSVAVADLTGGNGRPAIVAAVYDANGNNGAVLVFSPANTPSGFGAPMSFRAGAQPQSVKIADVNGDRLPDIIVANFGPGNDGTGSAGVSVLLQKLDGSFAAPMTYSTAGQSIDVFVADLNGDNRPDLVVANLAPAYTGSVSVLLQDPNNPGVFPPRATDYPALGQPLSVWVADLNGDGHPDIAIADGPSAGIFLQNATFPGTFEPVKQVGY
jgi:hypothetical protein